MLREHPVGERPTGTFGPPRPHRMTPDRSHPWPAELQRDGFVANALGLAEPETARAVAADRGLFDAALRTIHAAGQVRVPYLMTEAIVGLARDAAVREAVRAVLGTDEWVLWGPNVRVATPNAAHEWHVDLESLLWPTSVTLAVGLEGCAPAGATWFVPGTHRAGRGPGPDDALDGRGVQVAGFGDGRFYAFDASCWHRGDPAASVGRVVLFAHVQRAAEPRVPWMLDYRVNEWAREPAPYWATPECTAVNEAVHRPPFRHTVRQWARRLVRVGAR